MNMIIKRINKILLLILILNISALAQNSVEIRDTTFRQGEAFSAVIPVTGSIDIQPGSKLEIEFTYNAKVINILDVRGNDNFAMKNPDTTDLNFNPIESSTIVIADDDAQSVDNGVICELLIEGLAGPDSVTELKPGKVFIDEVEQTDPNLNSGTLTIKGTPVYPIPPEGMGLNVPNPFYRSTLISFSIKESSPVYFYIYSLDGSLKISSSEDENVETFKFFDSEGIPFDYNSDEELEKGTYKLLITPKPWNFGSGSYFLIMVTDNGVYNKSIMYYK